jgi:hypothetical protein
MDVQDYLNGVQDPARRADAEQLIALMTEATGGQPPVMWGTSMVGFGQFHYRYASKREGDSFVLGFAVRKQNLTLYLSANLQEHAALLNQLGRHTTGKGCLYLKRLSDADPEILRRLLGEAARETLQRQTKMSSGSRAETT